MNTQLLKNQYWLLVPSIIFFITILVLVSNSRYGFDVKAFLEYFYFLGLYLLFLNLAFFVALLTSAKMFKRNANKFLSISLGAACGFFASAVLFFIYIFFLRLMGEDGGLTIIGLNMISFIVVLPLYIWRALVILRVIQSSSNSLH